MPDVKFEIVQIIACLEDAKKHLISAKNNRQIKEVSALDYVN